MVNAASRQGVASLFVVLASLAGFVKAQDVANYTTVLAAAGALNLTGLAGALGSANLTATFSDPALQVIVLAPTNAAFAAVADVIAAFTPAQIAEVLMYHVLPQSTEFASLPTTTSPNPSLLDLANTTTSVTSIPSNGTAYLAARSPGALTNLAVSVTAARSRVYLIDAVMLPPSLLLAPMDYLTVAAAVTATPTLSTLLALVASDPEVLAILSSNETAVTVFAPTDAAFTALLAELNTTAAAIIGTNLANAVLKNHVLAQRPWTAAQFPAGNSTWATAAGGNATLVISVTDAGAGETSVGGETSGSETSGSETSGSETSGSVTSGSESFTVTASSASSASVESTVIAGKSVIHVINAVLVPTITSLPTPGPSAGAAGVASSSTTFMAAAAGAAMFLLALKL